MTIKQAATKGNYMNTSERVNICNTSKKCLQIDETYLDITNPIYDVLMKTHVT